MEKITNGINDIRMIIGNHIAGLRNTNLFIITINHPFIFYDKEYEILLTISSVKPEIFPRIFKILIFGAINLGLSSLSVIL